MNIISRAFLTADCSGARTVLLGSLHALGTMVAIYIPPDVQGESKPVSLGRGREPAEVGGGFSGLTHGRCGKARSLENVAVSSFQRPPNFNREENKATSQRVRHWRAGLTWPNYNWHRWLKIVENICQTISSDSVS